MARLSIAVVQGGPSAEAAVSRASATAVAAALIEAGHSVVRLELGEFLPESLRTGAYDVVFPAVHGAVGEDGSLQGLLEVLDLPYVGSGVLASALAMDKPRARAAFAAAGLPVAKGIVAARGRGSALDFAQTALEQVSARLVVKPSNGGSGIGVARFDEGASACDVAHAIEAAWAFSEGALLEHFARGREVTCGVLDVDGGPFAFSPTEIASPRDAFYTFEARYAAGRSVHTRPAPLPGEVSARVQQIALAAHASLSCRDLSRADFVVGDEGDPNAISRHADSTPTFSAYEPITLLEVNTIPGFTATSLYPEAAGVAGISLPALVDRLARWARARGTTRRSPTLPLPAL